MIIVFLAFFGLCGLNVAVRDLIHTRRLLSRGTRAEATVVERPWVSDSDGSTRRTVAEFRTADGTLVRITGKFSSFVGGASVGDRVVVVHDPANPEDALIDTWAQKWMVTFVGLLFAAIGVVGVVVALAMGHND